MSITPKEAIEDYIVQQLHFRRLYKMIFENRVMGPFIDAVPGLHDVVQIGKVWDLERQEKNGQRVWDLIIVDSPATGHGLTMLDSPAAMSELTRSGPMHRAIVQVQDLIEDPGRTALLLVSLPEAIPTSETIDLYKALPKKVRGQVVAVILNEVWERRGTSIERATTLAQTRSDPPLQEAGQILHQWISRHQQQESARKRLKEALALRTVEMPFLVDRQLKPKQLETLADSLDPLFDGGRS
jgi:anion-transporting  ArsA/GET3 family ATPase